MKVETLVCMAELAEYNFGVSASLLHAYAATMSVEDLCNAIQSTLNGKLAIRKALRSRLLRIVREDKAGDELNGLVERLAVLRMEDRKNSEKVDPLLSLFYSHLRIPTRKMILEMWKDDGRKSAISRWIKAITDDDALFDIDEIYSCWRSTRVLAAAKLLAYRAPVATLAKYLPELMSNCDQGWIAARAVIRIGEVSEDDFAVLRQKFPASYAYACATIGRQIQHDDALAIFDEARSTIGLDDQQGLAVWSFGQLGMTKTLDAIRVQWLTDWKAH